VAIHRTLPVYPPAALLGHVSGVVRVLATVGEDGTVKSVQVIDGPVALREAAVKAVQQWRYRPASLNGSPVESTAAANVVFRLGN
jgi:protein TonB